MVNVEPGWLNNVDSLYLVNVSRLSIGQQGSRDFASLLLAGGDLQLVPQIKEKLPVNIYHRSTILHFMAIYGWQK